jgi:hypothetical protein
MMHIKSYKITKALVLLCSDALVLFSKVILCLRQLKEIGPHQARALLRLIQKPTYHTTGAFAGRPTGWGVVARCLTETHHLLAEVWHTQNSWLTNTHIVRVGQMWHRSENGAAGSDLDSGPPPVQVPPAYPLHSARCRFAAGTAPRH